ncbi:MAG: orotidine-5'-phosphate decarboxylase [Patescibacteria group bacterium]
MSTTKHFADRLVEAIHAKGNAICVGLDPRLAQIPEYICKEAVEKKGRSHEAAAEAIVTFNKGIIDAVHDLVPVVKPQIAFYEQYGFYGVWAFEETCRYAQEKGLLVIADAKRNDIGSTAESYADGFLGEVDMFGEKTITFDVDALTVTPYLGYDGIKPFIEVGRKYGKGIFVLVKTSNPSSGDLQDQKVIEKNMTVYELMAQFVESWGADDIGVCGYSCVGAVVGATYPQEARRLRELMPHAFFLVPGYGAQGGGAADVKPCFDKDGLGAIVNSSRGIIFAYEKSKKFSPENYADAARAAVQDMAKDLKE